MTTEREIAAAMVAQQILDVLEALKVLADYGERGVIANIHAAALFAARSARAQGASSTNNTEAQP